MLEHQIVEEHFQKTYSKLKNGRFSVKSSISSLYGSHSKALGMKERSERYLPRTTRREYVNFMIEYLRTIRLYEKAIEPRNRKSSIFYSSPNR